MPAARPSGWTALALAGSILLVGACAGATQSQTMQIRTTQEAADAFLPQVEAAIAGLALQREPLSTRVNPCEGPQGQVSEEAYYIWVGLRGDAQAGDAAAVIEDAHARWQAAGWEITRFRKLDNGGVNLAATDPATGNTYALDSGFRNAPASALAGFFNTPCFRSPDGKVTFGALASASG